MKNNWIFFKNTGSKNSVNGWLFTTVTKLRKANSKTAGEGECTRLFLSLLLGLWRKRAPARARPFSLSSVPFTFQASLLRSLHATGNTASSMQPATQLYRGLEWVHLYKLPEEISTRRRATISLLNPPYPSFKVGTLLESWREAALDPFWRLSSKLCFCGTPRIRPALYTLLREERFFSHRFGHWGHIGQDFIK